MWPMLTTARCPDWSAQAVVVWWNKKLWSGNNAINFYSSIYTRPLPPRGPKLKLPTTTTFARLRVLWLCVDPKNPGKGAIFRFTHVRVFSLYYRYIYTFVCPVLIIYLLLAPCVLRWLSGPSRGPESGQARAGRNYRLEILRHDTVIMELISTRNWIKACGSNRKPLSEKYKI